MKFRWLVLIVAAIVVLSYFSMSFNFLNPKEGVWEVAGNANYTSGTYNIPGLQAKVNVTIDSSGVAHIHAANLHDLFMAQGYYSASNRLFQMELQAALAKGNLSAYAGKSAIPSDEAMHLIGLPQNAEALQKAYQSDYPVYYSYLQAYASGVNAYINDSSNKLPLGFKLLGITPFQWTVFDSLAWQEYMSLSLTTGIMEPLQSALLYNAFGFANTSQIWPYYPYYTENITNVPGNGTVNGQTLGSLQGVNSSYLWSQNWYDQWATGINTTFLKTLNPLVRDAILNISDPYGFTGPRGLGSAVGSNSWVVTANYSKDGSPILANDPHLSLYAPSLWIPMQLQAGSMNVTGWDLAGVPGILIGHTPYTSWGLTTSEGNSANDYLEQVNGTSYYYNGTWHQMGMYNYSLLGKKYTVYSTNNGPLIARDGNFGISVLWASAKPSFDLVAELKLDQSTNYTDMVNALKSWVSPPQNFAMVSGSTAGILTAGHYPLINEVLKNGKHVQVVGSRSLLNGTTSKYEPAGFVPFNYLPQASNPQRGYMFAPNQPTASVNYPYPFIGGFWASGGRAESIYHYLKSHPNMTVQNMMDLQSNVSDYWASQLTPLFINALTGMQMNATESTAYQSLQSWNYTTYQNETGITVYWYTLSAFYNDTFSSIYSSRGISGLPPPFESSLIYLARNDPSSWWFGSGFNSTVKSAFQQAVSLLSSKLGSPSQWKWGSVHRLVISSQTGLSALSIGPIPIWGDDHTVSVGSVPILLSVPEPHVSVGSSLREVSSPGQHIFYGVFPGGPSENPLSYYYSNQLNHWLSHSYYNMSLQKTEVRIEYAPS